MGDGRILYWPTLRIYHLNIGLTTNRLDSRITIIVDVVLYNITHPMLVWLQIAVLNPDKCVTNLDWMNLTNLWLVCGLELIRVDVRKEISKTTYLHLNICSLYVVRLNHG